MLETGSVTVGCSDEFKVQPVRPRSIKKIIDITISAEILLTSFICLTSLL